MADFLTGKQPVSGREGFPIFVGDELYAIKWHDWKIHFIWQASKYDPKEVFSTIPKVVNLVQDPREELQVAEPHNTWGQYVLDIAVRFQLSAAQRPHVPLGAPDDYRPPY